jgi:DNA polymerase alpha subunit A
MQVLESKGLDIVRRDWCQLSRDIGSRCLQIILSGMEQDEIVEAVHDILRTEAANVSGGKVELGKFVVTKQLTKRPEEYPDAKAQAHVQASNPDAACLKIPYHT